MCRVHDTILEYVTAIVQEIKTDIFSERYAEAKDKIEAIATLLENFHEEDTHE